MGGLVLQLEESVGHRDFLLYTNRLKIEACLDGEMMLEDSISEDLRWQDFIQRTEFRVECRMSPSVAVQTCFCRCNFSVVFLVGVQRCTGGAEAQRPMHNSEFDRE